MRNILIVLILFSFLSCNNENLCHETNDYEIIPGKQIGPYLLGMKADKLESLLCKPFKKVNRGLFTKNEYLYYIDNMSFIVKNGRVIEINVWGSFKGAFEEINVDYDRELLEYFGEIVKHKGEYRILDIPGIAFGIEGRDEGKYIRVFKSSSYCRSGYLEWRNRGIKKNNTKIGGT